MVARVWGVLSYTQTRSADVAGRSRIHLRSYGLERPRSLTLRRPFRRSRPPFPESPSPSRARSATPAIHRQTHTAAAPSCRQTRALLRGLFRCQTVVAGGCRVGERRLLVEDPCRVGCSASCVRSRAARSPPLDGSLEWGCATSLEVGNIPELAGDQGTAEVHTSARHLGHCAKRRYAPLS
jgi:hypothetical protein